jgi:hypothetical protein
VLLLAGCGWHGTGTVTDKQHTDAYTTTSIQCGAYSATGGCAVWVPITQWWPETWALLVHAADGDHWVDVDSTDYQTRIGAAYTVKGD